MSKPLHITMVSGLAILCIGCVGAVAAPVAEMFIPDFKVKPDDYTVLMACMGKHPEESKPFRLDHRQLQLTDWKLGSEISWEVWGHSKLDAEIGPPRYTAEQLARMVRQFVALGNVPILKCSIYQDGTFLPKTVEVIQAMKHLLAEPATIDPEAKLQN